MTHSIISLGQRAALSALLLLASCSKWTARPAFSVGHFDPLILLRVESGCPLGNLIFNDLEALQVESSGHFDHLIFRNRLMNFRSRIREEIEFHLADLTTLFSGN